MANGPQADWRSRAQAFRADDPDPDTQRELDALLAAGDEAELRDRFARRLTFGTAGLRGLLGAGDNRMNMRVVAQTTAGLCAHLATLAPDARERGLCVGFDGRHKSRQFALEVAAIANGAGFVVHAFEELAPTPLLAFSVLDRAAMGGVMVTASHNPAAYNGYKVYMADGAQLLEPHDLAIARAIDAAGPALGLPRLARQAAERAGLWRSLKGVDASYLASLRAALQPMAAAGELRVAYTALHGVGTKLAHAALELTGVGAVVSVPEQAEPDPAFPTVAFPNPEEPRAMVRLLELAQREQADFAIANDPDADRLALAVRAGDGMQVLTGNEVGVLLADYLLEHAPRDGKNLVVSTIVSTPMLGSIAASHDSRWETTLTGFKWIVQRGLALRASAGLRFVLGFEEALGYCIGGLVHDKDGIAAAAHVVRMAAWHKSRGATLSQALELLYRQHGLFGSRQRAITLAGNTGLSRIAASMQQLRAQPPRQIAGRALISYTDLQTGKCVRDGHETPSELPHSDVLSFEFEGGQRITIRPSGTEPKLKIYLDCRAELPAHQTLTASRANLERSMLELEHEFVRYAGLDG